MAQQLSFDLSVRPALGREDFFVSEANAVAVAMLDDWARWPNGKLLLLGAAGAGKTHLAHVWSAETGAPLVAAAELVAQDIEALASGPVCVEDVETLAGDLALETQLFHLHNLALAQGHVLLMTAQSAPKTWTLALPDLASRLQGTAAVTIDAPDDALLGALFMKLFEDRQLSPQPDVLPYLARHAPRRFDVAREIVETIDRLALQTGRRLTRDLARSVIQQLTQEAP
ncbi:chromosomal replication initiator DnaA [Primorskyibacter sp. S187A]|uniref:chromosomal replication initiator DnaA n=1 Tax=Primorskyibacter sp. S187A TaxID=3415130 RepID=UPI003C7D1970